MELPVLAKLSEYGILGLVLVVCLLYILRLSNEHKTEREEWRKQSGKQYDTVANLVEKNTRVITDLKSTLDSIERNTRANLINNGFMENDSKI